MSSHYFNKNTSLKKPMLRKQKRKKDDSKNLPTTTTSSTSSSNKQECAICLEDLSIEKMTILDGCIHRFCYQCIENWLKVRSCCPLCKEEVQLVTYRDSNNQLTSKHISHKQIDGEEFDEDDDQLGELDEDELDVEERYLRWERGEIDGECGQCYHDERYIGHTENYGYDTDDGFVCDDDAAVVPDDTIDNLLEDEEEFKDSEKKSKRGKRKRRRRINDDDDDDDNDADDADDNDDYDHFNFEDYKLNEEESFIKALWSCDCCNFESQHKMFYDRHLTTKEHKRNVERLRSGSN